ncbi:hypothetical protein [Moraxella lacunata]
MACWDFYTLIFSVIGIQIKKKGAIPLFMLPTHQTHQIHCPF